MLTERPAMTGVREISKSKRAMNMLSLFSPTETIMIIIIPMESKTGQIVMVIRENLLKKKKKKHTLNQKNKDMIHDIDLNRVLLWEKCLRIRYVFVPESEIPRRQRQEK